ncbi:MAG: cupredoxin domain-containing protein [Actinomycetota bacterium]
MKIIHRPLGIVIATGVATTFLFGCGSSSPSGSTNTDAPSAYGIYGKTEDSTAAPSNSTSQINIEGSAFSVAGDVKSTDVVSVTNSDSFRHTVTSDDGVFDVTVDGGATVSLPTSNAGTYAFHCKIHTLMQGTLTVV